MAMNRIVYSVAIMSLIVSKLDLLAFFSATSAHGCILFKCMKSIAAVLVNLTIEDLRLARKSKK